MALRDTANDIDASVASIRGSLRGLRTAMTDAFVALRNSGLSNRASWKARERRLDLESKFESARNRIRLSDELFHADRVMNASPGRFQSAGQVRAYEDRIRQIRHPLAARRAEYERTYGTGGGQDVLNAEYSEAHGDALMKLRDPLAYERKVLTQQFGSSAAALNFQRIRARQSFDLAMAGKDEQVVRGMMDQNGWTREQAEQVYFKQLTENTKWVRLLAFGNKGIAKNLVPIAKAVGKASHIPIIGAFASHPVGALAGLGMALFNAKLENAREVSSWKTGASYYGDPSESFKWALKQAGVGDEGKVIQAYGKIGSWLSALGAGDESAWNVYGDVMRKTLGDINLFGIDGNSTPEDVARIVAPQMAKLTGSARTRALNALAPLGIDQNMMKGMEFFAGTERPDDSYHVVGGVQHVLDTQKKLFDSRAWYNPLKYWAGLYQIPGLGTWAAHMDVFGSDLMNQIFGAAQSLDDYNSGAIENTTNNKSVSFHIEHLEVQADDSKQLTDQIVAMAGGSMAVIDYFNKGNIKW